MEKRLYYCDYWPPTYESSVKVIVSDIIFSHEKKYFQIHGIVLKKGKVLRDCTSRIKVLESKLINYIKNKIIWNESSINKNIIKIWFYNEDDSSVKPDDVPLRFAITALDIIGFDKIDDFRKEITSIICELYE